MAYCDCFLQGDFYHMKANYYTRYLSEVPYNLWKDLELTDAKCYNRERLYSVFQFLACVSNKGTLVIMTC